MTTNRDSLLEFLRAIIMIHIICIVHVLYWLRIGNQFFQSIILFEMPVIFFIAGASQKLVNKNRTFKQILINRAKRVLLPYYIFIPLLYIWMLLLTYILPYRGIDTSPFRAITLSDIIKTLFIGGSNKIPYYGYTWFIPVYFLLSISLPLQKKILCYIKPYCYLAIFGGIIFIFSYINLPNYTINNYVKSIIVYNIFYICGYLLYQQVSNRLLWCYAIISILIVIIGFYTKIMIPMQDHKFPADYLFMFFGIAWITTMSIIFKYIPLYKIKECKLIKIWNRMGYQLYLIQSISYCFVIMCTYQWINHVTSEGIKFLIYFTFCFVLNTILGKIMLSISQKIK